MERASEAFTNWLVKRFDASRRVVIFAGIGNNGGDGLAIGRLLLARGYEVELFLVQFSSKLSSDCAINRDRYPQAISVLEESSALPQIPDKAIIIDAIFGSGLSRSVKGWLGTLIDYLNASKAIKVSVDIASGLFADQSNNLEDAIIQPDFTVSFQLPKLAFLLPQNADYVGEWEVVPIGLSEEGIQQAITSFFYSDQPFIQTLVKNRGKFSHKGTFGHALLLAGSQGMIGAAVLASKAVLRTGAGLLTVQVPACGYEIMQTSLPEAMCLADPHPKNLSQLPQQLGTYKAIGIGPGIGRSEETLTLLKNLLIQAKIPIVVDADALNLLASNPEWLAQLPKHSILTPHPKEFSRLAGNAENEFERLTLLRDFAKRYHCHVVLKGAHSAVAHPDGTVYFNSTGNAGMATAGSGDVLTGMITGLLSQGYSSKEAALLGVFLHGAAGDQAIQKIAMPSLMASDLIAHISDAYQALAT